MIVIYLVIWFIEGIFIVRVVVEIIEFMGVVFMIKSILYL